MEDRGNVVHTKAFGIYASRVRRYGLMTHGWRRHLVALGAEPWS